MKHLVTILSVSVLIFSGQLTQAQDTYTLETFDIPAIKKIVESAYIEILQEDEMFIKVKDRVTFFIDVDKASKKRYILFNMNIPIQEGKTEADAIAYTNKVNSELLLIKSYYLDEKKAVYFNYYLWLEDGSFTEEQFIRALKIFDLALGSAYQKDTENVLK